MFKASLKFARLRIVATCYALVFLGAAAANGVNNKVVLALFLIIAVTIHANSINDYADKEIDKLNLKDASDRPLVANEISSQQFWFIHVVSGILALGLSCFYGRHAVILTIILQAVDYLYSVRPFRLSYRPMVSPVLLSVAYVFYSFTIGYWASTTIDKYPWTLAIGLCLGFIARLLLKDFRDVKGDKQEGKMTFLLRYGARKTCIASGVCWFIAMLAVSMATSFKLGIIAPLIVAIIPVLLMLKDLSSTRDIDKQQYIIAFVAKSANYAVITILIFLLCQKHVGLSKAELQFIPTVSGLVLLGFNWLNYINQLSPKRKHAP